MKREPQYTVCYQLTLAEFEDGYIVNTHQVCHHRLSETPELHEVFTELYEQFRSPHLLGLQITSIRCQQTAQDYWLA